MPETELLGDFFLSDEGSDKNTDEDVGLSVVRHSDRQYLQAQLLDELMDIRRYDFAMFQALADLINCTATSPHLIRAAQANESLN